MEYINAIGRRKSAVARVYVSEGTGKKETDKVYTRYTGYPGGQRFNTPAELRKHPYGMERILRHAVKGMLPKGPLGRKLLSNLYVYDGTEHPHEAQKPKAIDINQYK